MSDKTFKQQVEEIACSHCNFGDTFHTVDCKYARKDKTCPRDRILSAHDRELDRIADGMPKCSFVYDADNTVRAYIQAQKGS